MSDSDDEDDDLLNFNSGLSPPPPKDGAGPREEDEPKESAPKERVRRDSFLESSQDSQSSGIQRLLLC